MIDADLDDTARLILMDDPAITLLRLHQRLQNETGHYVTSGEMGEIWTRYRGWDGRSAPTHDVMTGLPR